MSEPEFVMGATWISQPILLRLQSQAVFLNASEVYFPEDNPLIDKRRRRYDTI